VLRDSDRTHLQQHSGPCVGDTGQKKRSGQHQSESQHNSRAIGHGAEESSAWPSPNLVNKTITGDSKRRDSIVLSRESTPF
jgi:hypothetical protein